MNVVDDEHRDENDNALPLTTTSTSCRRDVTTHLFTNTGNENDYDGDGDSDYEVLTAERPEFWSWGEV